MHRDDQRLRRSGSVSPNSRLSVGLRKRRLVPAFEACEARALLSTITVNVNGDPAGSPQPGEISLRQAITQANQHPDPSGVTILFNLPSGQGTIKLNSPLPALTGGTVINGGDAVTVDGSAIPPVQGTTANGIVITSNVNGSYIHGITITGFSGAGILINGSKACSVADTTLKNNGIGIRLTGANTSSTDVGSLQTVKPQSGDGKANTIVDNLICGVLVDGGASGNFIEGNVLYGNGTTDIKIATNDNRISGNLIGDDSQTPSVHAIVINAGDSNAIGLPYGTNTSDGRIYGNTITNASGSAILINGGSTKDTVYGNLIENSKNGVEISGAPNCYIGEPGGPYGNTITNNTDSGIIIKNQSDQTTVAANTITNNKTVNLLIDSSKTSYVRANRIDQGAIGIELRGATTSNSQIGYLQNSTPVTGVGTTNTITNMTDIGILIDTGANANNVEGNVLYGNKNADISVFANQTVINQNVLGNDAQAKIQHAIVLNATYKTQVTAATITNVAGSAIFINGGPANGPSSNVVTKNTIKNSAVGIDVYHSNGNEIGSQGSNQGNTIQGTTGGAVVIENTSSNNLIHGDAITNFSGIGLLIDGSSNNNVYGERIVGGDIAIDVRGGSNTAGNSIGHALASSTSQSLDDVNTLSGSGKAIVVEKGANQTTIARNVISGGGIGIVIYSDRNQIFGNALGSSLAAGTYGIILVGASGNKIGDVYKTSDTVYMTNTIDNYKNFGILLINGSGTGAAGPNQLIANTVSKSGIGIELQGGSSHNVIGLLPLANPDGSIRGNTITGSLDKGILLAPGADTNYISGNTVSTSAVADITIYSDNNQICGNTLGTDPDASNATKGAFGIILSGASGNHIGEVPNTDGNPRSNTIRNDSRAAILVFNGSGGGKAGGNPIYGNTIQSSTIGVEILGSVKTSVGASGVGTDRGTGRGNLIEHSTLDGVLIGGESNSNVVSFNQIVGVVNPGQLAAAAATTNTGVMIDGSSMNTIIGNTIRLNDNGVTVAGQAASLTKTDAIGNTIGNYDVGTFPGVGDANNPSPNNTGNVITENAHFGVMLVGARANYIDRNLISSNLDANVLFYGSPSNQLLGNWIGTNPTGVGPFSNNQGQGVVLRNGSNNNVLGALDRPFNSNPGTFTPSKFGNVISGNSGNGIFLTSGSQRNLVSGNIIGADRNGKTSVPNGNDGVLITNANANRILGNLIATNRVRPIEVGGTSVRTIVLGNITQLDS